MFDMPTSFHPVDRTLVAAMRSQIPAKKTAAPKTGVIDLSKPPTPEQADRLRSAGILGYGSVSAEKTVTTKKLGSGATVTQVAMDCQHEYFDVTNGATYQYEFSGFGEFTSGGSAFVESTTQMTCTWEDGSYWEATLHECAFNLVMGGHSSWYIPAHLNEDGSWSLAEYGPSAQFTISGYHSIFSAAYSNGEETQFFWSETTVTHVKGTIPSGPVPDGAVSLPSPNDQDLLDQLDRLADQLRHGFDARA